MAAGAPGALASRIGRNRDLGKRPFIAAWAVALALPLGGCGGGDSLNPANWFSSSDDEKKGAEEATAGAPARPPAPDWDALRETMADGLVADRENASHSGRPIPRQSEQLDAPAGGTR